MDHIDWTSLSDEEFVETAEMQIWLSAFASNNPKAPSHAEVDAAYDEIRRRGKVWLYQKAYNKALESTGYTPSDRDREAATEAGWKRQEAERNQHFEKLNNG